MNKNKNIIIPLAMVGTMVILIGCPVLANILTDWIFLSDESISSWTMATNDFGYFFGAMLYFFVGILCTLGFVFAGIIIMIVILGLFKVFQCIYCDFVLGYLLIDTLGLEELREHKEYFENLLPAPDSDHMR